MINKKIFVCMFFLILLNFMCGILEIGGNIVNGIVFIAIWMLMLTDKPRLKILVIFLLSIITGISGIIVVFILMIPVALTMGDTTNLYILSTVGVIYAIVVAYIIQLLYSKFQKNPKYLSDK